MSQDLTLDLSKIIESYNISSTKVHLSNREGYLYYIG